MLDSYAVFFFIKIQNSTTSVYLLLLLLLGLETWKFFEFVVSVRTIVYPLIKPLLMGVLLAKSTDTEEEAIVQYTISHKINSTPGHLHKTQLLSNIADELDLYRKELTQTLGEFYYQYVCALSTSAH